MFSLYCTSERYLTLTKPSTRDEIVTDCIQNGYVRLLEWYQRDIGYVYACHHMQAAVESECNRIELLQYLVSNCKNEVPWDEWTCTRALRDNRTDSLKVLQWLHENGCPWNSWAYMNPTKYGRIDIVKWLHENECSWDWWACVFASDHNQTEILKYLFRNRCQWKGWVDRPDITKPFDTEMTSNKS